MKEEYIKDYNKVLEIDEQIRKLEHEKERVVEKYRSWFERVINKDTKIDRYIKIHFELEKPDFKKDFTETIDVTLEDCYDDRDEWIDTYTIPIECLFDEKLDVKQFSVQHKQWLKKQEEKKKKQEELLNLSKEDLVNLIMKK